MPKHHMLSEKQRLFVDAFKGNATKAAEAAGYKNPTVVGSQNMHKPEIIQAIRERDDKIQDKIDRSGKQFIIATRKERQEFWSDTMKDEKYDIQQRLKASELLGKSEADFVDRLVIDKPLLIIKDLTGG